MTTAPFQFRTDDLILADVMFIGGDTENPFSEHPKHIPAHYQGRVFRALRNGAPYNLQDVGLMPIEVSADSVEACRAALITAVIERGWPADQMHITDGNAPI